MRQKQGVFSLFLLSPSSRRAWIEIPRRLRRRCSGAVALLAEGVDRNMAILAASSSSRRSPSSRRAWIEISNMAGVRRCTVVALLAEGVDRNRPDVPSPETHGTSPSSRRAWIEIFWVDLRGEVAASPSSRRAWIEIARGGAPQALPLVALLAEGVDRNILSKALHRWGNQSPSSRRAWIEIFWGLFGVKLPPSPSSRRAWIEIAAAARHPARPCGSPSSRRAWIEIGCSAQQTPYDQVALLAEGVDRNTYYDPRLAALGESPSSRRAWIEMLADCSQLFAALVALLAEGVDRNIVVCIVPCVQTRRPPRGGRG